MFIHYIKQAITQNGSGTGFDIAALNATPAQRENFVAPGVWNATAASYVTAGTTGATLSSILARIGAFTATGVNTVLGSSRPYSARMRRCQAMLGAPLIQLRTH